MPVFRSLALVSLLAGFALLLVGVAFDFGRDGSPAEPEEQTPEEFAATPTHTFTPAPGDAGAVPATPTPTPFDGAVSRLRIPRFGVDSAIEAIGLLPSNELATPNDPYNT